MLRKKTKELVGALSEEREGLREQVGQGACFGAAWAGKEDAAVRGGKFCDGLAAGSARLAGGLVEVVNSYGTDPDPRAVLGYRRGDCTLLGAGGQAIGGVFDVAAGDDFTRLEQDGRTHEKFAVGCISVGSDLFSLLSKHEELNSGMRNIHGHEVEVTRVSDR